MERRKPEEPDAQHPEQCRNQPTSRGWKRVGQNQRRPRAIARTRVASRFDVGADFPGMIIRSSTLRRLSCIGTHRLMVRLAWLSTTSCVLSSGARLSVSWSSLMPNSTRAPPFEGLHLSSDETDQNDAPDLKRCQTHGPIRRDNLLLDEHLAEQNLSRCLPRNLNLCAVHTG